ncbi:hypothetical protein [Candidatus Nitrotoga arctica]|uniref:Uncharacterized protein n=1 Tax=Candidatus Nitrotoga arctica TaxID=453162 RepID=A0ABN8ARB3_9PROT|nr:hypothetical protein [Candidatus Nitrotoga arctica]CAG9932977.1 protein of unknown function [Candidatus Nitrotoga arctica]
MEQKNISADDYILFATFIEIYPEIQLDLDLSSRRVDLIGERFEPFACGEP